MCWYFGTSVRVAFSNEIKFSQRCSLLYQVVNAHAAFLHTTYERENSWQNCFSPSGCTCGLPGTSLNLTTSKRCVQGTWLDLHSLVGPLRVRKKSLWAIGKSSRKIYGTVWKNWFFYNFIRFLHFSPISLWL